MSMIFKSSQSGVLYKKGVVKMFSKIHRKTPLLEPLFE